MLKKWPILVLLILGGGSALAAATQAPGEQRAAAGRVPPALRVLAARADIRPGWAPLARYAQSVRDRELKGLAYLALGYREYQAGAYPAASDHLARAAATGFSLADFADYYRAAAAQRAGQPDLAARALTGFKERFPQSVLGLDATRLLAFCLIQSGQPKEAIRVLEAAPTLDKQPPLEYLLGQAYEKAGSLAEAARTLQDVYYRFSTAPEAAPSATLLKNLQIRLGASYPAPSEDLRATRAGALEKVDRIEAALDEYQALLKDDPAAASAFTWRLGRDRCLIALGRANEALARTACWRPSTRWRGFTRGHPPMRRPSIRHPISSCARKTGHAPAPLKRRWPRNPQTRRWLRRLSGRWRGLPTSRATPVRRSEDF
jgi:tetratricopeptide (TPR) repeat protein